MPTLEEILKSRISGMNVNFEEARSSLVESVNELGVAVKAVSGNHEFRIATNIVHDDADGRIYGLILAHRSSNEMLQYFYIPVSGFPIYSGSSPKGAAEMQNKIKDKETLKKYFEDMAGNVASPLLTKLAFLLRK